MRVVVSEERRTRQSTLVKYLQLIGSIPEGSMFPNQCRPYLAGVMGCAAEVPVAGRYAATGQAGRGSMLRTLCSYVVRCMRCGITCIRLDGITAGAFGQLMYDDSSVGYCVAGLVGGQLLGR
jgi:hypothetical protein